jgi:dTDP-4-dehydrorhamnose reductase
MKSNKKVLILGVGGMIGHQMFRSLKTQFEVHGTLKETIEKYKDFEIFDSTNIFENCDAQNFDKIEQVLNQFKPDVILNCIGITLRKPEIKDELYAEKINSDFPQFLKNYTERSHAYLVHFSTDCVFSGKTGPYTEDSVPDAEDVYGRTKAKGEVQGSHTLTLRGSMIGRELVGKTELLEWALSQKDKKIKGYTKALYSGVTTSVMAGLIADLINRSEKLTGLYQVSSQPISKFELLQEINAAFKLNMTIEENDSYLNEKILKSEKLTNKIGFHSLSWNEMLDELAKDLFKYKN